MKLEKLFGEIFGSEATARVSRTEQRTIVLHKGK